MLSDREVCGREVDDDDTKNRAAAGFDMLDVGANRAFSRTFRKKSLSPGANRAAVAGANTAALSLLRTDGAERCTADAMPDDGERNPARAKLLRDERQGENAVRQVGHELLCRQWRVLRRGQDSLRTGAKRCEAWTGLLRDELPDDATAASRELKAFRRG